MSVEVLPPGCSVLIEEGQSKAIVRLMVICATQRSATQRNATQHEENFKGSSQKKKKKFQYFGKKMIFQNFPKFHNPCCVALRNLQLPYMLTVKCATQRNESENPSSYAKPLTICPYLGRWSRGRLLPTRVGLGGASGWDIRVGVMPHPIFHFQPKTLKIKFCPFWKLVPLLRCVAQFTVTLYAYCKMRNATQRKWKAF